MASQPKRQRVDLTGLEKRKICEVRNENPSLTHAELAQHMVDHHGFPLVDRSTVSKILEKSDRWLQVDPNVRDGKIRRQREAKFPQVEKALMVWFGQIRARRGTVDDAMLVQKAAEFRDALGISEDDMKLSHGWLERFKGRHGIRCHTGDADARVVGIAQTKLAAIIVNYNPEDVFNFDETGLYYRAPPSKTLNGGSPRGMKDRITLGFCANISGKERLKPIFIHKSVRPRCFPKHFDTSILVHYYSNSNAWMNGHIFTDWVTGENKRMASMQRKILMVLDNAASHKVEGVAMTKIGEFDAIVLSNITLLFLPANVTSVVQPLDQGVIAAFKLRYRRKLLAWTVNQFQASENIHDLGALQVDLLQCMVWVVATWKDIDAETVQNCWRVAAILPWHWNADIGNFQERVKSRMDAEVADLGKLIATLNLGATEAGNPIQKLAPADYIDMADENITEAEYSTGEIVELVENGQVSDQVGTDDGSQEVEPDGLVDKNDIEPKGIELVEARVCVQKLLDFMLCEGSSSFACSELLDIERICDKIVRMRVAHVTATQLSDLQ